jgi:hypothetical protein
MFAGLGNLDDNGDNKRALESKRENIKFQLK